MYMLCVLFTPVQLCSLPCEQAPNHTLQYYAVTLISYVDEFLWFCGKQLQHDLFAQLN